MVKWKVLKSWIWLRKNISNKLEPNYPASETQILSMKIFERAIFSPEAELLIAPISYTLYVQLNDLFIVLEGRELRIINGKYQYYVMITEKTAEELDRKFRRALESRIKKMESQVTTNVKKSLQNILEELSH